MGHQQCQKANNPSHICPSRSKGRPQNIPAPGHTHGLHLVFRLRRRTHTQGADISFPSSHNYSRSIYIRGLCLQDQSAKANKELLFKIQKSCTGPHSTDRHCGSQEGRTSANTDNSSSSIGIGLYSTKRKYASQQRTATGDTDIISIPASMKNKL